MQTLSSFSDALASLVETLGFAVVRVEARHRIPASGIVWADGVIATADHIVERDENIQIGLADGQTVSATLVGRDPSTDIAVLRIPADGPRPPAWVEPDGIKVGQIVLALGRPGRTVRARLGIIHASGQGWRTPAGGEIDRYLETDVGRSVGFSGGPLASVEGKILGLNTAGLLRRAMITVPVPTLRRVVEALLAHGRIRRGYLGVGAHPVRLPAALAQQVGQEAGLLVVSVEPGSPAERAGLLLGDVIVSLGDRPVWHLEDLRLFLSADRIDTSVAVSAVRGGRLEALTVIVGERA